MTHQQLRVRQGQNRQKKNSSFSGEDHEPSPAQLLRLLCLASPAPPSPSHHCCRSKINQRPKIVPKSINRAELEGEFIRSDQELEGELMGHDRADRKSKDGENHRSSPSDLDFTSNKLRKCYCVGSGSRVMEFPAPYPDQVLENVNVLHFLTSRRDSNAASLVCKSWYRVEAVTRSELFIGNCYAVSPGRATARFTRVKSLVEGELERIHGEIGAAEQQRFEEVE